MNFLFLTPVSSRYVPCIWRQSVYLEPVSAFIFKPFVLCQFLYVHVLQLCLTQVAYEEVSCHSQPFEVPLVSRFFQQEQELQVAVRSCLPSRYRPDSYASKFTRRWVADLHCLLNDCRGEVYHVFVAGSDQLFLIADPCVCELIVPLRSYVLWAKVKLVNKWPYFSQTRLDSLSHPA